VRETSLDQLFKYLLVVEFCFGAMLRCNLGSKFSGAYYFKYSRGPQVPWPWFCSRASSSWLAMRSITFNDQSRLAASMTFNHQFEILSYWEYNSTAVIEGSQVCASCE